MPPLPSHMADPLDQLLTAFRNRGHKRGGACENCLSIALAGGRSATEAFSQLAIAGGRMPIPQRGMDWVSPVVAP